MTPILVAVLLAAPPALPCVAGDGAAPGAAARAHACELLGAIDRPVPASAWRDLGPAADEVLAEIAGSADFAVRRVRALEGLAARGGPVAERVHRALASEPGAAASVRRAAIRGLGRLLPPADLPAPLRPLLERDADVRVRAAAAETLARQAPAASCGWVRSRAAAAPSDAISLERALSACDAGVR